MTRDGNEILTLTVDATVTACRQGPRAIEMTDRHVFAPWGLHGGKSGGLSATPVLKAGSEKWQDMREAYGKKSTSPYLNVRIRKGDRPRLVSPGGGGYGDPRVRDRELVLSDIRQGYISPTAAEREYGFRGSVK